VVDAQRHPDQLGQAGQHQERRQDAVSSLRCARLKCQKAMSLSESSLLLRLFSCFFSCVMLRVNAALLKRREAEVATFGYRHTRELGGPGGFRTHLGSEPIYLGGQSCHRLQSVMQANLFLLWKLSLRFLSTTTIINPEIRPIATTPIRMPGTSRIGVVSPALRT